MMCDRAILASPIAPTRCTLRGRRRLRRCGAWRCDEPIERRRNGSGPSHVTSARTVPLRSVEQLAADRGERLEQQAGFQRTCPMRRVAGDVDRLAYSDQRPHTIDGELEPALHAQA